MRQQQGPQHPTHRHQLLAPQTNQLSQRRLRTSRARLKKVLRRIRLKRGLNMLTTILVHQCRINSASLRSRGDVPFSRRALDISSNGVLRSSLLCLLLFNFFRVTVKEHINHDIPAIRSSREGPAKSENLPGEEPPNQPNGMASLVVSGNGDVDEFKRGVGVGKSDDGDVD